MKKAHAPKDRQTDKQTNKQTNRQETVTQATSSGVHPQRTRLYGGGNRNGIVAGMGRVEGYVRDGVCDGVRWGDQGTQIGGTSGNGDGTRQKKGGQR